MKWDDRERHEDLTALAQAIFERRAILFVGAGVSMQVGLPWWQALTQSKGSAGRERYCP
jgi:hypothetical protein